MGRRPLSRIYTGKPGRPVAVESQVVTELSEAMLALLDARGVVACGFPKTTLRRVYRDVAKVVVGRLRQNDLHVVPGAIVRELALFTGEAGPMEPHGEIQS